MAPTFTTKLGLEKPDPNDNVDIALINQNMDDIDAAFSGIVASYRNAIRNGDFTVWQRGNGPFAGGGPFVDGFVKGHTGGTHTANRVVLSPETFGPAKGPIIMQSVVAGQSAVGDYAQIYQNVESVRTLSGQQVTISFVANATSGTPKIGIEIQQNFGTGGSPSASVGTSVGAITISTTATKYSVTFTLPSIAGKTLGTNDNDYLSVGFWFSAGSNFAARASNIGIQNSTINITDIQLEAGNVATAFERLPQQAQLAWCQRYYWRGVGPEVSAQVVESNSLVADIIFPVTMRTVPTQSNSALAHVFNVPFYGGTYTCTQSIAPQYVSNRRGLWVYSQTAWGLTGGRFVVLSGTSYLEATAEL